MAIDLQKTINTDYMKFDAYSMKERITKFLSEDQTFTDQMYEGSNLSVLVDLVSQHFQSLMYYLNHSASESMFSDSVIYENMNRLVKILNYSPTGYLTSSVNVSLHDVTLDDDATVIPEYTTISTGAVDKNGDNVYFSTVSEYHIYDDESALDDSNIITMYNGQWKLYERTMISEGLPYESFTLSNIISDSTIDKYVSFPYIHVWVKRQTHATDEWIKYIPSTGGLLMNGDSNTPFKSDDRYFDLRLNEYKQYEITFGDGIHGQPLTKNDELYIVYMTSNGPDGEIESNTLDNTTGMETNVVGLSNDILNEWHTLITTPSLLSEISLTNVTSSSSIKIEESPDEIRENAPQWFKSQGRLITRQDYTHFIKSKFSNDIIDVVVMNNWDYISTFYAWLYNIGVEKFNDGSHFLKPELSVKYDYMWSDSCDSNNIYMWIKMKNNTLINKTVMDNEMRELKVLTSEPVFMEALETKFIPCAYIPLDEFNNPIYDPTNWDNNNDNYIEVYIDSNNLLSVETVKSTVNRTIVDYFYEQNQKIGSTINMNDIYTKLSSIRGVKRIRTVYDNGLVGLEKVVKSVDGLKFAYWTNTIVDGVDLNTSNGTIQLERFKFPELNESTLMDRIKVITDSIYQNTTIEY